MKKLTPVQIESFLKKKGLPEDLIATSAQRLSNRLAMVTSHHHYRVCLLPEKPISKKTIFLASSRLGRSLDDIPSWFDALRTAAARLSGEPFAMITADGTTTDRYLGRISELWGFEIYRFAEFPDLAKGLPVSHPDHCVYYDRARWIETDEPVKGKPAADYPLSEFADLMLVLRASQKGTIQEAARIRLNSQSINPEQQTRVLIDKTLTPPKLTSELLDLGATGWHLLQPGPLLSDSFEQLEVDKPAEKSTPQRRPFMLQKKNATLPVKISSDANNAGISTRNRSDGHPDRSDTLSQQRQTPTRIVSIEDVTLTSFLHHWTRRCHGKWPDQTENDYLDDLIFGSTDSDHSPFHALCRILNTKSLLASDKWTRDNTPVVSWTEVPLKEFPNRRVFRQHLARWDFEPYGISIRKKTLITSGCRPVQYGDESDFASLAPECRAFFQLRQSSDGRIDWTLEQEFRHPGNLDLGQCEASEVSVFTRTYEEAELLATLCDFQIVVVHPHEQ